MIKNFEYGNYITDVLKRDGSLSKSISMDFFDFKTVAMFYIFFFKHNIEIRHKQYNKHSWFYHCQIPKNVTNLEAAYSA